jgi:hypothetical protein
MEAVYGRPNDGSAGSLDQRDQLVGKDRLAGGIGAVDRDAHRVRPFDPQNQPNQRLEAA